MGIEKVYGLKERGIGSGIVGDVGVSCTDRERSEVRIPTSVSL